MKAKSLLIALLMAAYASAGAKPISVNVSMPGSVNPFTGYQMTYTDKDRASCSFRFNLSGDGLAYITADKECPSFVTEQLVFIDAQKALDHMNTISTAFTFAEFYGEDEYGNRVERAELKYRCAPTATITPSHPIDWAGITRDHLHAFVFMPISSTQVDGWYELDVAGYGTYEASIGAWQLNTDGVITGSYMGRVFTIPDALTARCQRHRLH